MNWNPSLREPAATSSTAMTRQARGRTQPAAVALSTTEVHLWLVHLDGSDWYPEDLVRTLSPDELRRADAFAYSQERRRFIVGRALLRRLLARYLRADPAAVVFAYGPHGKPELAPGCDLSTLRFNCAHSGPLALYAVAAGRRVGVDLEELRPLPEVAALTQLCCSPRERATLATLPRDAVEPAVLRAWTLKEAYVKATGEGLALPPEQVEVAVAPSAPPALRAVRSDARPAARWVAAVVQPRGRIHRCPRRGGARRLRGGLPLEPARRRLGSARPPTPRDLGTATADRLAGPASRTSGPADNSRRAVPGLSSQYAMSGGGRDQGGSVGGESAVALR